MPVFERIGRSPFKSTGYARETKIPFSNGSFLEIAGEGTPVHFRMKFGRGSEVGWWINPIALDEFITELLYIRRDVKEYQQALSEDLEGAVLAEEEEPVEVSISFDPDFS